MPLDYNGFNTRFNDIILNEDALQGRCSEAHAAAEALNSYTKLLTPTKNGFSPDPSSPEKSWKYWEAQAWAVLVCCNWELQERALKEFALLLSKKNPPVETTIRINELNGSLLEKHPLCLWGSDAQKTLIKTEFASFLPKSAETSPDTNPVEPPPANSEDTVQHALKHVTELQRSVQEYTQSKSEKTKKDIQETVGNLTCNKPILQPYISSSLLGLLDSLPSEISGDGPIGEETISRLTDLCTRLLKELNSLSGQEQSGASCSTEEK